MAWVLGVQHGLGIARPPSAIVNGGPSAPAGAALWADASGNVTIVNNLTVSGTVTIVGAEEFQGLVTITSSTGAGAAGALGPREAAIQNTQAATAGATIRNPGYIDFEGRYWSTGSSSSTTQALNRMGVVVDTLNADGTPATYRHVITDRSGAFLQTVNQAGLLAVTSATLANGDFIINDGASAVQHAIRVAGETVFNEQGAAQNFRIETDTMANFFQINGTAQTLGVGTGAATTHHVILERPNFTSNGNFPTLTISGNTQTIAANVSLVNMGRILPGTVSGAFTVDDAAAIHVANAYAVAGGATITRNWAAKFDAGIVGVPTGTVTAPGLTTTGNANDVDTGLFWPAADDVAATAGGVEVWRARNTAGAGQIGFFAVTPASRASAYTQTFSLADKTHAAFTSADLATTAATQTSPWGFASQAQAENIATQFNLLRADVDDAKRLINSVIDDLQSYGLAA